MAKSKAQTVRMAKKQSPNRPDGKKAKPKPSGWQKSQVQTVRMAKSQAQTVRMAKKLSPNRPDVKKSVIHAATGLLPNS
jgi:hypothetical protein